MDEANMEEATRHSMEGGGQAIPQHTHWQRWKDQAYTIGTSLQAQKSTTAINLNWKRQIKSWVRRI
jgi:hypothetical protein